MRKLIWYIRGYAVLEICGASPERAMNRLTAERIPFWDFLWLDSLTVQISVLKRDVSKAMKQSEAAMCDVLCIREHGFLTKYSGFLRRPVLIFCLLLTLLSACLLQRYILFYDVIGNETIPEELIIRELQSIGIGFGKKGASIRPQWVKDHMIGILPQLQWLTITQNGCRAQVVVRERIPVPQTISQKGFANVVATQSGIITSQSILAGQRLYQVGDTVNKGDVLVSGIVDLERIYVLENARAEIFARTWRSKTVKIPSTYTKKSPQTEIRRCFWLVIGNKRIKIFGNSGISYASCDKMIAIKEPELPEDLHLPIRLEIETFRMYESERSQMDISEAKTILMDYAEQRARSDMIAGEILKRTDSMEEGACFTLHTTMECHEMIAESVPAKWNNEEFANDRTYSKRRENGADH